MFMNNLKNLLLTSVLFFSSIIPASHKEVEQNSYLKKYLPLEEKLREIENDFIEISSGICMYKAMRYYLNAKVAGEDAYLTIGLRNNSKDWHAWVGIKKNNEVYYVDPSLNNPNIDGLLKESYDDRKEIYVFNSDVTIKEFVYYKNLKSKNIKVKKEFNQKYKKERRAKIKESGEKIKKERYNKKDKKNTIEGITNYCKQDTSAWNYYLREIEGENSK